MIVFGVRLLILKFKTVAGGERDCVSIVFFFKLLKHVPTVFLKNLLDLESSKINSAPYTNQSRQFQVYGHLTACTMSIIYSLVVHNCKSNLLSPDIPGARSGRG